jgi:hypothetical protein
VSLITGDWGSEKQPLTDDMREHPKTLTTTLYWKLYRGTRLIVEPYGKKVRGRFIDLSIMKMGNPQTAPKSVKVRIWSMSQRLPVWRMKSLTNSNDCGRYSLIPYESKGIA